MDLLESERSNLRAALTWALEAQTDSDSAEERTGRALELIAHVWPLWLQRGYTLEGNEWLNQLLSVHTAPTLARSRALLLAGDLAGLQGDYERQAACFQESLALARTVSAASAVVAVAMPLGLGGG